MLKSKEAVNLTYAKLDKLIIGAIRNALNPLYEHNCWTEAHRIASLMDRKEYRVIDARIQYLRKRGAIRRMVKSKDGKSGWVVVDAQ